MSPTKLILNILDKLGLVLMIGLISIACVFDSPEWERIGATGRVEWYGLALATGIAAVLLLHILWYRPSGDEVPKRPSVLNDVFILVEFVLMVLAIALASSFAGGEPLRSIMLLRERYVLAGWALIRLCRVYANCIEVYWDLLWSCPFLAFESLFLTGLAFGHALAGYGLVPLFWSDGVSHVNSLIVASLSSSMMILTYGVLFLCAYFHITHRYEQALDGPGGLSAENQISRRVVDLWNGLLPGHEDDPTEATKRNKYPGVFVWICCRPLMFLMALPALMPLLAVEPMPTAWARLGWFGGLSIAAFVLRLLLVRRKVVLWVVERVEARASGGGRAEPAYPTRINGTGLSLIVLPILFILATTHMMNKVLPSATSWTSLVVAAAIAIACFGMALRHGWTGRELLAYCGYWLLLATPPWALSILAALLDTYLAAPFGVCWVLMTLGYVGTCLSAVVGGALLRKSDFFGRQEVRRGFQIGLILFVAGLLALNGWSERGGLGEINASGPKLIEDYEQWYAGYVSGGAAPNDRFGSENLKGTKDHEVLAAWRKGSPAAGSDEALRTGSWRRDPKNDAARWIEDTGPKPKLVVVAVSGGGLRAAVWSEKVLYEIAREIPEFGDRTRLVTGSSGGMLGAACFVAGLTPPDPSRPETPAGLDPRVEALAVKAAADAGKKLSPVDAVVDRDLHRDFLTPVLQRMIFGDLFSTATNRIPKFGEIEASRLENIGGKHVGNIDRGWVLENAFSHKTLGIERLGTKFDALLKRGEGRGRLPSLVFTPTIVEDSRRLVVSNLDLGPLVFNHGAFDAFTGREKYDAGADLPYYSCTGIQLFHLFPGLQTNLDLACAVRMNATFPYVTPAVGLRTQRRLRVVDAGYYDNYGIDLATAWLEQHRRWLEANTSGVVLVQVRAFSNERQLKKLTPYPTKGVKGEDREPAIGLANFARGTEFVTTPLATIGAARSNVNYYRNDSAVENLKRSFTFDVLERLTGIPAGLPEDRLTDDEKTRLKGSFSTANGFFRVITFTCSNPETDDPKLAEQETLSWYLSGDEFRKILKNWDTLDNYRRFQYLRDIFRRRFEVDDESKSDPESDAHHPGWLALKAESDPFSVPGASGKPGPGATNRGEGFKVWRKGDVSPDGPSPDVAWEFKDLPPGVYRVSVNMPRVSHLNDAARKKNRSIALADRFKYRASVVGDARVLPELVFDRESSDWADGTSIGDANPGLGWTPATADASDPARVVLRDSEDVHGSLGLWYRLGPGPIDLKAAKGPVTVRIVLSAGDDDKCVVADSVRLERVGD